jgi:hypothetical protein
LNVFVEPSYTERIDKLAVGFEPLDPLLAGRLVRPVRMEVEGNPPRAAIDRHHSCLHVLLYQPSLKATVVVRIWEATRCYVPRRLRIPLLTVGEAESRQITQKTIAHRVRRPVLFPGAAYDAKGASTGLRGRVVRGDGTPVRWARVEARLPVGGALLGRAHADDRGEFLLLLAPLPPPAVPLEDPLNVRVTVFGLLVPPLPVPPDLPSRDPLWDLPEEVLAAPGDPDPAAAGEVLPAAWPAPASADRIIPFRLGRVLSGVDDFHLI